MKRVSFINSVGIGILSFLTLPKLFKKKEKKEDPFKELKEIILEGDLEKIYIKRGYIKTKPNEGMAINNDVDVILDLLYGHHMWINTKKKIYSITSDKIKRPKNMVVV